VSLEQSSAPNRESDEHLWLRPFADTLRQIFGVYEISRELKAAQEASILGFAGILPVTGDSTGISSGSRQSRAEECPACTQP